MTLGDEQQPLVGKVTMPLMVETETEGVVTRRGQVLQRGLLQVDAELVGEGERWLVRNKMFRWFGGCWYSQYTKFLPFCDMYH